MLATIHFFIATLRLTTSTATTHNISTRGYNIYIIIAQIYVTCIYTYVCRGVTYVRAYMYIRYTKCRKRTTPIIVSQASERRVRKHEKDIRQNTQHRSDLIERHKCIGRSHCMR